MTTFDSGCWALIIGGSGGFGLASARKLARHGMNLCIVHRDRRGAMARLEPCFEEIRAAGVTVITFNVDGLSVQGRTTVLDGLSQAVEGKGRIRMFLHAVASGNLKLLAPWCPSDGSGQAGSKLARKLSVPEKQMNATVRDLFEDGVDALHPLAAPPEYLSEAYLDNDDFTRTIQAMGFNIVEWVQDLNARGLFAKDARVLSLTSEGNRIAWRGYAAVSAAKAVLESVSRAMAVEFAPYGIRSNVIQAGVTETAALKAIPGSAQIKAKARLRNPCGRLTRPEDVADVIFLLCLDEAAWINGALIHVDGGERIGT